MLKSKSKIYTVTTITSTEQKYSEKSFESDSEQPVWKCRYVIAILGFFSYNLLSINRSVMSIAIIAMVNSTAITQQSKARSDSCPSLILNTTHNKDLPRIKTDGEYNWSPQIQGYLLASYFIGIMITTLPVGILVERYGCKWFLLSASMVTGVSTLLIPTISSLNVLILITVLIIRGLAQGLVQPPLAILASNWFPTAERGPVYAFMISGISMGTVVGFIVTGYICDSPGAWPYSFYATGATDLFISVLILFFVAESPKDHSRITKAELDFILKNQECSLSRKRPKIPWRKMLTSIPVYALSFSFFGHIWALSVFWTVQATFLDTILHYPIRQNGIFVAVPFLVHFLFCQTGSWFAFYMQKINVASIDFLRKFLTLVACLGFSGNMLGIYFAGCNRTLSVIFGILAIGFNGLEIPGTCVVVTDMAPTFSGSLFGIACTIGFAASFIVPIIVGHLTEGMQTIEQWNKVFFISIGVVMSSGICFAIFGSAKIQPWNFVEEIVQTKNEKNNEAENVDKIRNDKITRF